MSDVAYRIAGAATDAEICALHAAAFEHVDKPVPWNRRLTEHSLFWVTARIGSELVGFVNVLGDGGAHAIVLDTAVSPMQQRRGVGAGLLAAAAVEARNRGCHWLHADYTRQDAAFYEVGCGFRPTSAGLLRLTGPE